MAQDWLIFSLISLFMWGLWGIFGKMATSYGLDWKQITVVSAITSMPIILLIYLIFRPSIDFKNPGIPYALLTGMTIIGSFTFYMALSQGKASVVVPLTALYPVITALLAFLLLKESITYTQVFGILLAVLSISLLSLGV
jgi:transporter family protein